VVWQRFGPGNPNSLDNPVCLSVRSIVWHILPTHSFDVSAGKTHYLNIQKANTRFELDRKRLGKSKRKDLGLLAKKTEEARLQRKEELVKKQKAKVVGADELARIRKEAALEKLP
jgi:hypothetical protein